MAIKDYVYSAEKAAAYDNFELIPEGKYRVRIEEAVEMVSQNTGRDMVKLKLKVSGFTSSLWHYIVFGTEYTDKNLRDFWNSFGIEINNLNLNSWIGKTGACQVKHEEYEGKKNAKVHYFCKADGLPAWQENAPATPAAPAPVAAQPVGDEEYPWD